MFLLNTLRGKVNRKNYRSILVKRNILYGFVFKGGGLVASLLLVRVTLDYLDQYQYGIWLTLSSILTWFNFFDIGIGNGLRNKLGTALAERNYQKSREYVSTAFLCYVGIALGLFVLFCLFSMCINWSTILNISNTLIPNLNLHIVLLFFLFLIDFVLKNIGIIYVAHMLPFVTNIQLFINNVLTLGCVYFLSILKNKGSFGEVGFIFMFVPVVVSSGITLYTFLRKYKYLLPSIKYFRKECVKSLLSLGGNFFIIQLAVVILFFSSNVFISHLCSPAAVTPYNIAQRYYGFLYMIFSIIAAPIWSSVTNAYAKDDFSWIQNIFRKLMFIGFASVVCFVIMFFLSSWVYKVWIGEKIQIPIPLSIAVVLYNIFLTFNSIFSPIINGTGKIKLQLYGSLVNMTIYPVFGIILGRRYGVTGIVCALNIVMFWGCIVFYIQTRKIIYKKDYGIWSR